MLLLFPALLLAAAAFAPLPPCRGWSPPASAAAAAGQETPPDELLLVPLPANASVPKKSLAAADGNSAWTVDLLQGRREGASEGPPAVPSPPPLAPRQEQQQQQPREEPPPPCNISVQRQMLSSLLVRWSPLGLQCDLVLFSTGGPGGGGGGRAFFSAAFHRVGPPPLLIEHVGLAAGGGPQDLRLCVGCSWARGRRVGRLRPGPAAAAALFSPSLLASEQQQQGERLHFCCLDFSLEELKGDPGWRMNRKPIESTLVACFMTLVIIVWSVAALIWPVPIIAGFLPNGMEQRRSAPAPAAQ